MFLLSYSVFYIFLFYRQFRICITKAQGKAGLSLLAPGYRIIINVYPGHLEGTDEGNALADFLATL
ncbi:MAG: hypothetical protein IIX97_08280, partial [Clostridia bacterium]|nr:hypothetical protein [Clostridia bacterium]